MTQYQKGTIHYINNQFKIFNICAEIARMEPPCTVIITYRNEKQLSKIKKIINNSVPLGVECKFKKY